MILWSFGMVTSINSTVCSRLSRNIISGRLALISLSVCIQKSYSILKFSFSSTGEGSYLYHSQFFARGHYSGKYSDVGICHIVVSFKI